MNLKQSLMNHPFAELGRKVRKGPRKAFIAKPIRQANDVSHARLMQILEEQLAKQ